MAVYKCSVCDTIFDESKEGQKWDELHTEWKCNVCESGKSFWQRIEGEESSLDVFVEKHADTFGNPEEFARLEDELEVHMFDIHQIAETGKSIIEPMRTRKPTILWDEILIKGSQLAKLPLNQDESVNTKTIIGPKAKVPLVIETPIYVTHMSFGALSREAKIALAKGSAAAKTATCSGEGGILPDSMNNAYKYIFEYVSNQYSVTKENLQRVDAIEIKIGQSAKPGMMMSTNFP